MRFLGRDGASAGGGGNEKHNEKQHVHPRWHGTPNNIFVANRPKRRRLVSIGCLPSCFLIPSRDGTKVQSSKTALLDLALISLELLFPSSPLDSLSAICRGIIQKEDMCGIWPVWPRAFCTDDLIPSSWNCYSYLRKKEVHSFHRTVYIP